MRPVMIVDDKMLQAALVQKRALVPSATQAALEAASEHMLEPLRARTPRRTGAAAGALTIALSSSYAELGPASGPRWYIRHHERGTRKMGASPFVDPTVGAELPEAKNKAGRAFMLALGL